MAEWTNGKLTVWTGTQRPFGVRSELAEAFSIPEDRVRVIVPDTGSGYGGKHTGEVRHRSGASGEGARQTGQSGLDARRGIHLGLFPARRRDRHSQRSQRKDGLITAWEFHNYNSGRRASRRLTRFRNRRIEFHPTDSPLRQGSYRGLAATANHFARESHMDELAAAAGMDPLEFRLKNLKDDAPARGARSGRREIRLGQTKEPSQRAVLAWPAVSRRAAM